MLMIKLRFFEEIVQLVIDYKTVCHNPPPAMIFCFRRESKIFRTRSSLSLNVEIDKLASPVFPRNCPLRVSVFTFTSHVALVSCNKCSHLIGPVGNQTPDLACRNQMPLSFQCFFFCFIDSGYKILKSDQSPENNNDIKFYSHHGK